MRTRTQVEIKERMATHSGLFFRDVLEGYLSDEEWQAAGYHYPNVSAADQLATRRAQGRPLAADDFPAIKAAMGKYMEFAWDKVADQRGISASRSIEKMQEWAWLLGDDEVVAWCNDLALYPQYGAPILGRICEKYGFPIPESDILPYYLRGEDLEESP